MHEMYMPHFKQINLSFLRSSHTTRRSRSKPTVLPTSHLDRKMGHRSGFARSCSVFDFQTFFTVQLTHLGFSSFCLVRFSVHSIHRNKATLSVLLSEVSNLIRKNRL